MIVPMTGRTLTTTPGGATSSAAWRRFGFAGARLLVLLVVGFACPLAALAQDVDVEHDARIEGYQTPLALDGSSALTWMLFVALAVVGVSVLFKNAKRSHLD